jgi:Na+-transporting methylmalonyl-CoA/oxaloacetate decarboxylase gamma subunit
MKKNYSRGSVGGVILIVVGIVLCFLLLGVLVKTYRNSGMFSNNFVPNSSTTTPTKSSATPSTSNSGGGVTVEQQQGFVPASADCRMVITEPDDEDTVDSPIYFSGYLTGCGTVSAQKLLGNITLYRYGTSDALGPAITLRNQTAVREGNVNFSGYFNIPSNTNADKGVMKFKHFLPDGSTRTQDIIVYF